MSGLLSRSSDCRWWENAVASRPVGYIANSIARRRCSSNACSVGSLIECGPAGFVVVSFGGSDGSSSHMSEVQGGNAGVD